MNKVFEEWHEFHQVEKSEGVLFGDGGGVGGWSVGGSPARPAASVQVEGLLGDDPPKISMSLHCPTADVPSRAEVQQALRRAASASICGLVKLPAPQSNTGHKFTVHWAAITAFCTVETLCDLVALAFIEDFTPFDGGAMDRFQECGSVRFYNRLLRGPGGIVIKCENRVGAPHCSVELSGEALDLHGVASLQRLLASLEDTGQRWHFTRLDCAWDGVEFTPRRVFETIKRGDVRSLAERESLSWHETPFGEDAGGTCYFGKRGSADFLRVYDRRATGTRIEHECRGDRAKWMGLQLLNTPLHSWHRVALANLRDFFDLVKRRESKNVTRCTLLGFWREFVQDVERCEVRLSDGIEALRARAAATVESVKTSARAVVRRAAKIFLVAGESLFVTMVKNAAQRLGPSDLAQVEDWKLVVGCYCDAWSLAPDDVFANILRPAGDTMLVT